MDRKELIELVNKIYKLTLLFPKKEPLRYKIREVTDNILTDFITWEVLHSSNPGKFLAVEKGEEKELIFELEKNSNILNSYFEIAKWQNWVSYFDILEIQERYGKIRCNFQKEIEDLGEEKSLKIEFPPSPIPKKASGEQFSATNLNSRKEKILEILKEKGKVQVWEAKEFFPEVSKRTLRRDFEKLLKKGLIERMGERNNTFYKLNPVRDSEGGEKTQNKSISNGVNN